MSLPILTLSSDGCKSRSKSADQSCEGRTTISYPLFIAVLALLALSYRISLTKHTNRQAAYNLARAVRGLLRGGDDVHGAVKPSMSSLQATVALVTHAVELPLPILRTTAVVVLCYSNTTACLLYTSPSPRD